jgi:signal transduction histidine kinase
MAVVLYIDDEPENLLVLKGTVEDELEVITAADGESGLALLAQHEVGVILADQRMPGMSGIDVLERAKAVAPDAVRVMITAYANINEAITAINLGAVERYIKKPWDAVELVSMLREALSTYDTRRKLRALDRRLIETERVYSLGVVAATVAHELRGQLTGVTGLASVVRIKADSLRTHLDAGDLGAVHETLDDIGRSVGDLVMSAEQVLQITRGMELGQRQSERSIIDVREVVTLITRMLRGEIARVGALEIDLPKDLPPVRGARHKLGQVLLNLVVNALQALPAVRRATNRVAVRVRHTTERLLIEVEDNGPGVPAEAASRIFDPFFTTKTEGGTGLGLAISRRIVEEMGGQISFDSRPGCTCFAVSLPVGAD